MTKERKIGFVGCAGTGKSTLANALADRLGVPFISSRKITQGILERDGYDYGSGIRIERFLSDIGKQKEILQQTIRQHESEVEFVTDRTVIDLAAYAVCELHEHDMKALRTLYDSCRAVSSCYTHLIVCPWRDMPVEDNKRRTVNPWYQLMIAGIDLGILQEWGLEYTLLESRGYEDRMEEIMSLLQ